MLPDSAYAPTGAPTAFVAQVSKVGPPSLQLAYGARQLRDEYALSLLPSYVEGQAFPAEADQLEVNRLRAVAIWEMVDAILVERERRDRQAPEPPSDNGRPRLLT